MTAPAFAHSRGPRKARVAFVGEAVEVPLSRGLKARISAEDYERVMQFEWYADMGAWASYAKSDGPGKSTYMHRFIMQPKYPNIVHHIDGDGLHNTRWNLEIASQSVNARLRSFKRKGRFRGVYPHYYKFTAQITVNYRKYYLGIFATEEEAALAYNRAVLELCGEAFPLNEV